MAFWKAGFLETYLLCYDAVWWLVGRDGQRLKRLEQSVANDLEDSCNVEPDYKYGPNYWPKLLYPVFIIHPK